MPPTLLFRRLCRLGKDQLALWTSRSGLGPVGFLLSKAADARSSARSCRQAAGRLRARLDGLTLETAGVGGALGELVEDEHILGVELVVLDLASPQLVLGGPRQRNPGQSIGFAFAVL